MSAFLITLVLIVCVLLVLVILAQNSKGGGLMGMSSASQVIGARRTTDWLEKTTWGLGIAIFVLSLGINATIDKGQNSDVYTSPNIEKAKESAPAMPTAPEFEIPENAEDAGGETQELTAPIEEEGGDATQNE